MWYITVMISVLSRYQTATVLGVCGLFIWSIVAWMAVKLTSIPPFQFLMITQGVTVLSSCARLTYNRSWHTTQQPIRFWIIGSLCFPLNLLGYFWAFRYIDAALAELIYYTYPVHVLILHRILFPQKLPTRGLVGCLLCFVGIYVLFYQGSAMNLASWRWEGFLLALLAAASWAIYTLVTRSYWKAPYEMTGLFYTGGFIIASCLHFKTEAYISPSAQEWTLLIVWGLVSQNIAMTFWEKGMRQGNFAFLNAFSYAIPILSICILVLTGYTPFTTHLVTATCIVTVGIILSNTSFHSKENSQEPTPSEDDPEVSGDFS